MQVSKTPKLGGSFSIPRKIPQVMANFGESLMGRDTVRNSIYGDNRGIGMGFDANGQIALSVYYNEIPEGKSGFLSVYDAPPEVGVSTPLPYYWRDLRQYGAGTPANIEDTIWFFIVNPPLFDVVDTNITKFQHNSPGGGDTAWGLFPLFSPACLIFITQGELFTTNAGFNAFI